MAKIRVIARTTGSGLRMDSAILCDLMRTAGHQVEEVWEEPKKGIAQRTKNKIEHWCWRYLPRSLNSWMSAFVVSCVGLFQRRQADINIFLEVILPRHIPLAQRNLLIPNQEWFRPEWEKYFPWIDLVLCKTREAERLFGQLRCKTKFISFTSEDKYRADVAKDFSQAIHFSGNGLMKGTPFVLNAWNRNAHWPDLWVTQRRENRLPLTAANIHFFESFLSGDELARLQNAAWLYIGPSEAEGFGHSLVEAMSAGAIVVTTDAAPMNEVIAPDRGFLVKVASSCDQRLGKRYQVDLVALESAVEAALSLSLDEKRLMGARARQWYLDNDRFFRQTLLEVIEQIN